MQAVRLAIGQLLMHLKLEKRAKTTLLRRVHNTTQGLALRRVSRALTLVATHWNARIDSDPISAFLCVAFMRLIKIF